MNHTTPHTVIIGAGIGGLTAGALLLQAGHRVTVLEAQAYPGGCAGTFYYQGYRFDAGATLAGGFAPGGPHHQLAQRLPGLTWPVAPVDPAWVVHLPDGRAVTQWASAESWRAERRAAFPHAEPFWQRQELLADLSWDISQRHFPWPPASVRDLAALVRALRPRTFRATPDILRTIGDLVPDGDPMLNAFIDANLLISAQATADQANALYGSAALDLPRRGVNHVQGGIGAIADTLVAWLRAHGGQVLFKQHVDGVDVRGRRAVAVHSNRSHPRRRARVFECDFVLANQTPWGLATLLGSAAPAPLRREVARREPTWGAFMLYLGLDRRKLPVDVAGHHQVINDHTRPLGETNSIFLSLSPADDPTRAPDGMVAANISTHTAVAPWWALRNDPSSRQAYHDRRDEYVAQMLDSAEKAIPGFKSAVTLCLPATPVTYAHWTDRPQGMVGGFPQKSILQARGPQTGLDNVWLVGDSIFPGQSTAGVTVGGMRVAQNVLDAHPRRTFRAANPVPTASLEIDRSQPG